MCSLHWQRTKAGISFNLPEKKNKGRLKAGDGETQVHETGYRLVYCRDRKKSNGGGRWFLEHRVAMEQKIGRELLPHENVHHINGDRLDNRPENLELWSKSQPAGQRVDDKLAWAQSLLNTYSSFDCEKALAGELDAASGW